MREGEAEAVLRVVIEKALAGNLIAARFCADRLVARPYGRALPATIGQVVDSRHRALQAVQLERRLSHVEESYDAKRVAATLRRRIRGIGL